MGVGCPRGRLSHRRGRSPLSADDRRPWLLCAPVGGYCNLTQPPDLRAARARILLSMAALCAGGRRPAREIATRELRSECSISRPALALPPPTGTAATPPRTLPAARPPCGARPARPLAVRATSFARRVVSKPGQAPQASRHPPVGRLVLPGAAVTHRHHSHTTDTAATPASAANPPSNTNYTKRPGQQPHKQTVNNLRTAPGLNRGATTWRR